jgi:outer membrane biosynthesis protein TonB
MSHHDRGGGPPHDEPLAFDRRDSAPPRGPAPLTLILSVLLLLALAAAVFAFYQGGLSEGARAPRAIGEPVGEIRAPAPNAGSDVDPAAGLRIYQQAEGEPPPLQPNFTPPPEQPLPRQPEPSIPMTSPAAPPPVASPPPAAVTVLPKPAAQPPSPAPTTQPAQKPPPRPAPPPVRPETPPARPAASGAGAGVQIGAFSSEAIADREWAAAVASAGGRTTVTGFPDRAAAQAFCDRLKAAGKSCFVR